MILRSLISRHIYFITFVAIFFFDVLKTSQSLTILLWNYWPFSPNAFFIISCSNCGFCLTRNKELKTIVLSNFYTFNKAPLITKYFIVFTINPTNCFEIKISIKFGMNIRCCISNLFSEKPLTILYISPSGVFSFTFTVIVGIPDCNFIRPKRYSHLNSIAKSGISKRSITNDKISVPTYSGWKRSCCEGIGNNYILAT